MVQPLLDACRHLEKRLPGCRVGFDSKPYDCAKRVRVQDGPSLSGLMVERWETLPHFSASCSGCQ